MNARTNTERLWLLAGIVGALAVLALGWLVFISPQLSDASSLHAQRDDIDTQNIQLEGRIQRLRGANMDSLRKELANAREALPSDSGLPDFTRQLAAEAAASLVKVTSITAGAPTLATASAPAAATAGSDSTPAAPRTTTGAAGNIFAIPVTIIVSGTPAHIQTLLHKIQSDGPRRALVVSAILTPSTGSPTGLQTGAQMTVQTQIFVAPQDPAAEAELDRLANGGK